MTFVFLQLILLISLMIFLIMTFNQKRRAKSSMRDTILVVEILAMILLCFCFVNYEMSSFQDEKYFVVFTGITLVSGIGYWVNKYVSFTSKRLKLIMLMFTGSFFWLCFFTAIKFGPYLPYVWFPLLGLYALAPIIIGIITLSEIRYQSELSSKFNVLKILGLGLIPLILLQLLMNFYTPYLWEFVKIFEPSKQFF